MTNEVTRAEFARLRGIKPSYVTELAKAGRLVLTDDGKRVRVAESIASIEATRDPSKQAVADRHAAGRAAQSDAPADEPESISNPDYQAARAKREHYAAEREEMRYRQEAGELLVATEVAGALSSILTELRTRLETLPDTLGPQLAPVTDEQQVRARLADEIEVALGDVAHRFSGVTK